MSLLSVHALLFLGWLLSGSGEGFGVFIVIFWVLIIGFVILFKWIDKKSSFKELAIEDSADGKWKAIYKLNNLHWTPTGSTQTSLKKYIAFRMHSQNTEDFDWLVKYITAFGFCPNGDVNNPYAKKTIMLGGSEYSCNSVNPNYTVTEIYRIPYSEEEINLLENLQFSKTAPKAKSLTEAMYMHMRTNTFEPTYENAIDNLITFAENNKHLLGDTPKSSKLNKTGIVEDVQTVVETTEYNTLNEEHKNAVRILEQQNWEQINNANDGRKQYCCRKQFAHDPDDFKWVVKYLSGIGTPEQPKNPCSYVISKIDGIEYKTIKVNKYFEGTVIYKFADAETDGDNIANNESDLFTQIIKNNIN